MKLSCVKIKTLLTIYRLALSGGEVRSMDIASHLHVSRPTVSRTLAALMERGYLENQKRGNIRLSSKGLLAAKEYQRQYESLHPLFAKLLCMKSEDAHECALSLLSHLSEAYIEHIQTVMRESRNLF